MFKFRVSRGLLCHHFCSWKGCPLVTARCVGTSRFPCDTAGGRGAWLVPVWRWWKSGSLTLPSQAPRWQAWGSISTGWQVGESKLSTQLCVELEPATDFVCFVYLLDWLLAKSYCLDRLFLSWIFDQKDQTLGRSFWSVPISISRCPASPVPSLATQGECST